MNRKLGRTDYTLLIFALAVFLFNSPLNNWWSNLSLPWYTMFTFWAVIIALVAWNQMRQEHGD